VRPIVAAQGQERAVIRVLTSGFNPAEVSGEAGSYRVAVTRPSGEEEVKLELRSASGELIQELVMPQQKLDWTTLIELQRGSYTLRVVNHPQWMCRISVQ
jgi:hypothetical protein